MSKLGQLLAYLDRNDVHALVFRSGNPAKLETASRVVPLTAVPLSSMQIRRFFAETELGPRLPAYDEQDTTMNADLLGRMFSVTVGQAGGIMEVRVQRGGEGELSTAPTPQQQHETRDVPLPPHQSQATAQALHAVARGRVVGQLAATSSIPTIAPRIEAVSRPRLPHIDPSRVERASKLLLDALTGARQRWATDVHILSDNPLRIRKAKELMPIGDPIPHAEVEAMAYPLLEPHTEAFLERSYADFSLELEGAGRMRVNICKQRTGLKLCFRMVAQRPPTVEELGLPEEVRKLEKQHQGLIVISGPNGHGKTTTMAALLDMFNSNHAMHIITVEDPVEILHPRKKAIMSQREVGTHTNSFQAALKAALREDPDVIAIGELRDRETVEMALSASETGHLVLATMSTPSAAKSIDRLIDLFPPDDQSQVRATMAGALKLLISQRLVRDASGEHLMAAYEMVTGNVPLWTLIRDNKLFQLPSLLQRGRNYGMIRIDESLKALVAAGHITREEALLYAEDRKAFDERKEPSPELQQARSLFGRRGK